MTDMMTKEDVTAMILSAKKKAGLMAAEWVQTGDMPIFSAISSQVRPAFFLAERIIAVTSSLVIISVIIGPFMLVGFRPG